MTESPPSHQRSARKEVRRFLLFVCLVIWAAGGALYVHRTWIAEPDVTNVSGLVERINHALSERPASQPATGLQPGIPAMRQWQMPLQPLSAPPGNITPPPGATCLRAYQRVAMGVLEQYARYDVSSTFQTLSAHYRQAAEDSRLRALDDRADDGRRVLIFAHDRRRLIVVLQAQPADPGRSTVMVQFLQPPQR